MTQENHEMSVAIPVGSVYLIVKNGECAHDGGEVVAVFDTRDEAQGFCYQHEESFHWVKRTVWAWPEIIKDLPGYYASAPGDKDEYDLSRPPKEASAP